jgi:type IV pilus assembly protein PilF
MNGWKGLICLICMALLVACASTGGAPDASEEARKAAEVNTALGREYMSRGQNEVALEKLKKAIAADPDYAPGHTMIAVLYEQIGEIELAGKHYQKAVKASPRNGDVNNNYGVFLCATGRYAEAEQYYLKAVEDPFYSTPEVAYGNAGSCMLQDNNLTKAEKYLRQSIEYNEQFIDSLMAMSGLKYRTDDYMSSRAFLQRYEAAGGMSAEGLLMGMQIERRLGDSRAAQEYENQLLRRYPDSVQAREVLAGGVE